MKTVAKESTEKIVAKSEVHRTGSGQGKPIVFWKRRSAAPLRDHGAGFYFRYTGGFGRTWKDSALFRTRVAIIVCAVLFQSSVLRAEPDIHAAKFWQSHCQKSDMACIGYLQALLDINNASRENGEHVRWCAPHIVRLDNIRLTILREMKAKPEKLSTPFITFAMKALETAYPCLDDLAK